MAEGKLPELTRHADDLYTVDHDLVVGPVAFGTRTTVVVLRDGGLVLHSPGPLADLREAGVPDLGPVKALVAPNLFHHFYLAECAGAFEGARVFGPPGLDAKQPGVEIDEILDDTAPALWRGQLDQVVLRGAPRVAETVFFHPSSRTVLVTDLVFNFQASDSRFTRVLMRAMGAWQRLGPSRLFKSMLRDRAAARTSLDAILAWDFDRLIPTHGDIQHEAAHEALEAAYRFLS